MNTVGQQESDDHDWLEALAGRASPSDAVPASMAEARLLREALRAWPDDSLAQMTTDSAGSADELVAKARADRVIEVRAATPVRPARSGWAWGLRWPSLALTGGGLGLAAALMLALLLGPFGAPSIEDRGGDDQVLRGDEPVLLLRDAQPRDRRDALAKSLIAAGAEVARYERLGREGLDARWDVPASVAVVEALRGVGAAADRGQLRIEFERPAP